MGDFWGALCLAIFFVGCAMLLAVWGARVGREVITESCIDHGKFKVEGKFYECKPL